LLLLSYHKFSDSVMGCGGSKETANSVATPSLPDNKALTASATSAVKVPEKPTIPTTTASIGAPAVASPKVDVAAASASAASAATAEISAPAPAAVKIEAPVMKPVEVPKVVEVPKPSIPVVADVPKVPELVAPVAPVAPKPAILESKVSVEKVTSEHVTVTPEVVKTTSTSVLPSGATVVEEKVSSHQSLTSRTESFSKTVVSSSLSSSTPVTEAAKTVEVAPVTAAVPAPQVEEKVEVAVPPAAVVEEAKPVEVVEEIKVEETKVEEVEVLVSPPVTVPIPTSPTAAAAPPAKKIGMIFKQGHMVKNWKNRFFVLEEGTLNYYENAQMKDKKGDLSLKGTVVSVEKSIVKLTSESAANDKGHTDLVLEIKYPNERDEWVKAIQNHIDYYSK